MEEAAFVYQQEKFTDSKNSKINIRLPITEKVCMHIFFINILICGCNFVNNARKSIEILITTAYIFQP